METLPILAAICKRDAILDTLANMKPFLNIHELQGIYFYRFIIILKLLFSNYAMTFTIPKNLTMALLVCGNMYLSCNTDAAMTRPCYFATSVMVFSYVLPSMGLNRFMIPTLTLCALSMNLKPYEFFIDMLTLFCFTWYAFQTYEREIQKLSTITFLMLSIDWYICNESSMRYFNPVKTLLILSYLIVIYFPLMPNPGNKNRNQLLYFYAVMFIWVLYKIRYVSYIENMTPASEIDISTPELSNFTTPETCDFKDDGSEKSASDLLYEMKDLFMDHGKIVKNYSSS